VRLVVRRLTRRYAVDALTWPTSHDAGQSVWLIGSSMLAQIGWAAIIYGGVACSIVGGAYLLLVLWGPAHALRVLWGIVLLAALLATGVVALGRQTLREFPDAQPGPVTAPPLAAGVTQAASAASPRGTGSGE
jgi:hypothetical protein